MWLAVFAAGFYTCLGSRSIPPKDYITIRSISCRAPRHHSPLHYSLLTTHYYHLYSYLLNLHGVSGSSSRAVERVGAMQEPRSGAGDKALGWPGNRCRTCWSQRARLRRDPCSIEAGIAQDDARCLSELGGRGACERLLHHHLDWRSGRPVALSMRRRRWLD